MYGVPAQNRFVPGSLVFFFLLLLLAIPNAQATEIPLPLIVDGQTSGEILSVIRDDDTLELDPADLADALEDRLDPAVGAILRSFPPGEPLPLATLSETGLEIVLDMDELVVRVTIPAELRRTRRISLRGQSRQPTGVLVAPSAFSVILNADAGIGYSYAPDTFAANLVLDPAVSFFGVAVESRVALQNTAEPAAFDFVRATWDVPGAAYRVQAGDLAWRTTQLTDLSGILGVSFFRLNDSANRQRPERVLLQDIFLHREGEVLIEVNGRQVRRLVLPAGSYRLSGLGLPSGNNVVRVVWPGPDGPREIEIVIPVDNRLLERGEVDAGVAMGLADRDPDRPVAAAYQRLGLSENLTIAVRQGVELQPPDTIRQLDGGVELLTATPIGTFAIGTDIGIGPEDRRSFSVPLRYTWIDTRAGRYRNVDLTTRWHRQIDSAGVLIQEEIAAGAAVTFVGESLISVTPRITWGYNGVDGIHSFGGHASLRAGAGSRANVRVNAGVVYRDGLSFVASVSVGAALPEHQQNLYLQQNLVTQDFGAFWNRYSDESVDPFDYRAGFQIPIDPERVAVISGGAGYRNQYLQSSVSHLVAFIPEVGDARNASSVRLQSGLVYVDGLFALTRPIGDSFIIISPEDHVSDHTFRLRQNTSGRSPLIQGSPLLLGGVRSNEYRQISVEMEEFDPSIDSDDLDWLVQPRYRSGTHVRINPPRLIQIRGILTDRTGRPLPLVVGSIEDGSEFFTDETGYFEIYDLLPGRYLLRIEGRPSLVYDILIKVSIEQIQDMGSLAPQQEEL